MKAQYSGIGLICFAVVFLMIGCNNNSQQGKYSEEEMSMIPRSYSMGLPEASGGYTLRIFSETISVDDILPYLEKTLKPDAETLTPDAFLQQSLPDIRDEVRGQVVDILLYQEARKDAPENIDEMLEKNVESEIAKFVSGYNNNYALAEKAIKNMGMDWKSFREYEKRSIMIQTYISSTLQEEKRFSNRELMDYYESMKAEQFSQIGLIEFSLIDIIVNRIDDDQITEGQSKETVANAIADEVMAKLDAGEDFAALAEEYSDTMASNGGKWTPHTIGSGSLPAPYDQLEAYAVQMKAGDIQGPIKADGHIFILKLERIQDAKVTPFEDVKQQLEHQLLSQYRYQQYQELVQKLMLKADFLQLERFSESCAKEAYKRWGQTAN